MEDYVYQIRKYLPIGFTDDEANHFLEYLEEAYLDNAKNQKYQFAFIAFHMLYMTFCYKIKWFLKTQSNKRVDQTLQEYISKNKGIFFNVLFDLSKFPEKDTFGCLLSSLKGFNANDIDNCKIHVTKRNHCVHASGKIEYEEKDIDYIISDELKYIDRIQIKVKDDLAIFFESFLKNNWNKSLIGSDIENWFIENNISRKDLEIISGLSVSLLKNKSDNENVVFQKILYLIFINETQKYIDTERNIFVERLPMFMIGLKDEIKIQHNGEEKTISMREIIEDNLVPIINNFPQADRQKAEEILKL